LKKIAAVVLTAIVSVTMLAGCAKKQETEATKEKIKINMVVPDGLPALSVVKMLKEKPEVDKSLEINYEVEKTADSLVSRILKEEPDVAIVPSNVAAIAYNKGLSYRVAGTVGFGSLYLITSEGSKDIKDLKGKEVYNVGKGLTPDLIFKKILKEQGIDGDKDLTLSYVSGATELAPLFISGKAKLAVVPEPMLTTILAKKPDTTIISNLNDQWKNQFGTNLGYPQSTLIIKKDLYDKDKVAVEKLIGEIKNSVAWVNSEKDKAGAYGEEVGLNGKKDVLTKAIERANLQYVDGKDTKDEYSKYYDALFEFDGKTVGGKKVDEGIYLQK
jgi:NitT/TauT family transport system substrate-binding protein